MQRDPDRPTRLADDEARRVLELAAKHDALQQSGTSVEELREAAIEAGISESAFEAALAESRHPRPAQRPPRYRRAIVAAGAVVMLFVGAGVYRTQLRESTVAEKSETRTSLACAPDGDGVPLDRLMALARQSEPEALRPDAQGQSLTVALLLDDQCQVRAHRVVQRTEANAGTGLVERTFPDLIHGKLRIGGVAGTTSSTAPDQTMIVWGIYFDR